ncbi:MAG: ATP-dependent DNA helicase, partial [Burkholderiales bacterium]
HHLFFADLALREEGVAELLPTTHVVVFDEAHQLPEVGTLFLSRSASTRQLVDLARDLAAAGLGEAPDGADWTGLAAALERAARELRLQWPAGPPRRPAHELARVGEFGAALQALCTACAQAASALQANAERGALLARCAERAAGLNETLRGWHAGSEPAAPQSGTGAAVDDSDEQIRWAEAHARAVSLYRTPLSIADAFSRHRDGPPRAWIFVSATLALDRDFSHFTGALGLGEAHCLRWDSPFDFERNALLYVPDALGEPGSDAFTQRLVEAAWPLVLANHGRAFVLCTSLRAVRVAAQRLRELCHAEPAPITVLEQGERPRTALLQRFRDLPGAVLVGSASFWEGVDIVGERLSLVVIDKLPFAAPNDPVMSARIEAHSRRGKSAFEALQLPMAAISLKQGSGRLIRSETDRGLLMIGDERLLRKAYGRRLVRSLPPFPLTRDARHALDFIAPRNPRKPGAVGAAPSATPPTSAGRRAPAR